MRNKRQLFIDDDVIACVRNVTRRQHTPKKHPQNPLIEHDQPWEVTPEFRLSTFNVIRDPADSLFKCWYVDFYDSFGVKKRQANLSRGRVMYARSKDGLTWEKPALGKHFIGGHDTNIVVDYTPEDYVKCPSVLCEWRRDNVPPGRLKS